MKAAHMQFMVWFISAVAVVAAAAGIEKDAMIYIVHMDKSQKPAVFSTHGHWYQSIVSSIITSRTVENESEGFKLLYVYDHVMHGFSAKLTQTELDALRTIPGHLASYPDTTGEWHTTHSFKILGLKSKSGIWPLSEFGNRSDVIVGILDSGIWPESESFRDDGMNDVPSRWKGKCQEGAAFNSSLCNRKLIGARYFSKGYTAQFGPVNSTKDYDSARDFLGHGSHTSSTAAGNYVHNVDYFGYAKGTARGVVPRARVAMYKIGWSGGIVGSDILAGMENAISDGVDVMSLSLTVSSQSQRFHRDAIALGAFAAAEKGVFVSCSAGNNGSDMFTVANGAPWMLTVGASTIDRSFVAKVKLGNGKLIQGTSLFVERQVISGVPVIYGTGGNQSSRACAPDSLDPKTVAGKILLCINNNNSMQLHPYIQLLEANRTGAAAVIIASEDSYLLAPWHYWMPAVLVTSDQGQLIANYVTSASRATARIKFVITEVGSRPAPAVAFFSSRGPNPLSPGILKPDVIAPGENIVAAWLPYGVVKYVGSVPLEADYAMDSGTSMSSPHAVGVAALVKAVHPDWSPAAIRSALMTTAYTLDNTGYLITDEAHPVFGHGATPLDFGAGHLNANKAADPGLVYDSGVEDYLDYLCALNYTNEEIRMVSRREYSCPGHTSIGDLNYPSFLANFTMSAENQVKTFKRILTNLADDNDNRSYVYRAIVKAPQGIAVQVKPESLVFNERKEKLGFSLIMEVDGPIASTSKCAGLTAFPVSRGCVKAGYLSWVDGRGHVVTSPLVATFDPL